MESARNALIRFMESGLKLRAGRLVFQLTGLLYLSGLMLPLAYCPYPLPWVMCLTCHFYLCPGKHLQHPAIYLILGSAIISGRTFCGWLCPFGTYQDIINWLSKKFSKGGDIALRSCSGVKYILLLPILLIGAEMMGLIDLGLTSYFPLVPLWAPYLFAIFLFIAAFTNRFFCRFLCPVGAVISPFNRLGLIRLKIRRGKCQNCKEHKKICPVGEVKPDSTSCIGCLECFKCPI